MKRQKKHVTIFNSHLDGVNNSLLVPIWWPHSVSFYCTVEWSCVELPSEWKPGKKRRTSGREEEAGRKRTKLWIHVHKFTKVSVEVPGHTEHRVSRYMGDDWWLTFANWISKSSTCFISLSILSLSLAPSAIAVSTMVSKYALTTVSLVPFKRYFRSGTPSVPWSICGGKGGARWGKVREWARREATECKLREMSTFSPPWKATWQVCHNHCSHEQKSNEGEGKEERRWKRKRLTLCLEK